MTPVLVKTRTSRIVSALLMAGLVGGLIAGCSGGEAMNKQEKSPLMQIASAGLNQFKNRRKTASPDPRKTITREMIDASPIEVLFAGIESRDAFAIMSKAGANRDVVTWLTGDGSALNLRQGVLVSTRGLGQDLMGADVSQTLRALHTGGAVNGATTTRIHDYLDGDDQIVRESLRCNFVNNGIQVVDIYGINRQLRKISENCSNSDLSFTNTYWVAQNRRIWQSRQWASPKLGYVFVQHLSR